MFFIHPMAHVIVNVIYETCTDDLHLTGVECGNMVNENNILEE